MEEENKMANCTKCGNPLDASETRCSHCGTIISNNNNQSQGQRRSGYYSTTQQVAYPKSMHDGSKMKVRILAALSVVAGIESLLYAANIDFNPALSQLSKLPSMIGFLTPYMAYTVGLIGAIALFATYGYFKHTGWAWKAGVVSAVLSIFTIMAPNLIGFVLGLACLGMLLIPSIRSSFK